MNKADELKARLRNHAKEVVDFSGGYNEQRTQTPKIKFIRLDMALSAIDEFAKARPTKDEVVLFLENEKHIPDHLRYTDRAELADKILALFL